MAMSVVYTTINGVIYSENRGGVETEFVPDTLGSVWQTRDMSGNVTSTTEYWPYGEVQSQTGTNPSHFGFVGLLGYLTDLVKLLYVRARHLNTSLTRWMTVDPLWPSELAYRYGASNPILYVDPTGKQIAIPPPPPGIPWPLWYELIALILSIAAELGEILAVLALIALVTLLIYLGCRILQGLRNSECPSNNSSSGQLTSCLPCDSCWVLARKANSWLQCVAIQVILSTKCFDLDLNHFKNISDWSGQVAKCLSIARTSGCVINLK